MHLNSNVSIAFKACINYGYTYLDPNFFENYPIQIHGNVMHLKSKDFKIAKALQDIDSCNPKSLHLKVVHNTPN